MKYCVLFFLSVLLFTSCVRWRKDGVTKCVKIEEVPSKLLNHYSNKTSDSTTKLSVQLHSNKDYPDFEYTGYKISNLTDSTYYGVFNKNGHVELEVPEGMYSIEFKTIHHVEFKLDSINVLSFSQTQVDIEVGTPGGFMTVQKR